MKPARAKFRNLLCLAVGLGVGAGVLVGCDKQWDVKCEAEWGRGDLRLSQETYEYKGVQSKNDGPARCKQEMLKNKPKRATSATCKCVAV